MSKPRKKAPRYVQQHSRGLTLPHAFRQGSVQLTAAPGIWSRAGRSEARWVGAVEADGQDEAERLARELSPGLRLRVLPPSPPPGRMSVWGGPKPS
jgi:hypothetical protein